MFEIILNRWRGTGNIFGKVTGNMIYAFYWFILILCLSDWYWAGLTVLLYLVGESYSWGKWLGFLCYLKEGEKEYYNKTGRSFPWIHYIANFFINQENDYLNYCRLALFIRGLFWFAPMLVLFYFIDLIGIYQLFFGLFVCSAGFPIAAELSNYLHINIKYKYFTCETNWEIQECIYGLFQFIGITSLLFI